jgi:hypothetical protein
MEESSTLTSVLTLRNLPSSETLSTPKRLSSTLQTELFKDKSFLSRELSPPNTSSRISLKTLILRPLLRDLPRLVISYPNREEENKLKNRSSEKTSLTFRDSKFLFLEENLLRLSRLNSTLKKDQIDNKYLSVSNFLSGVLSFV